LAERYGVQSYPTIKLFQAGEKSGDADDYEGGRTSSDIVSYLETIALESAPPPDVVQLTGEDVLETECNSKQLCFIAVLPLLQDSGKDGRNSYIDMLKESAAKYVQPISHSTMPQSVGLPSLSYGSLV
jgi:protein disulfide-isomerase A6